MSKPQKLRKGKYKVTNWPQYNRSLKGRGDLTIWFTEESLEAWLAGESACKTKGVNLNTLILLSKPCMLYVRYSI